MIIDGRAIDRGEESVNIKKLWKFEPKKRKVRKTRHQGLVGNSEDQPMEEEKQTKREKCY